VIGALAAERAREPPGEEVRPRRPHRRLDDPRATAGEDLVECRGERAVPAADQELKLNPLTRRPRSIWRLRACRAARAPAGWAVTPRICTARVWTSITNRPCTRCSSTVPACRKSQARMPDARAARKCREAGDARRAAGQPRTASKFRYGL
jgi:hypothetical protein